MTTNTAADFDPKVYIEQLKRCDIETIAQLEKAINEDLDCNNIAALCRYYRTNSGGIVRAVADELGMLPKRKKVV